MIAGFLCANPGAGRLGQEAAYREWLVDEIPPGLMEKLHLLFEATRVELGEFSDFQFRILMPDDDTDIDLRSKALKSFCSGFLSGFGPRKVPEEISEPVADFESIAALRGDVEDGEENESDLFEIVEFVRVSVLLIYAEMGAG